MKLIIENWRKFINEQRAPVVHFMDWLVDKTERVHGKPGQGSVFAISAEKVKALVEKIVSQSSIEEIEEAADGTGVLERKMPGIGYDLVAKISNGKVYDRQGKEVPGQMMTTKKEERGSMIDVPAIKTTLPAKHFSTDKLTIIIRHYSVAKKNEKGEDIIDPKTKRPVMEKVPGEYIILSAFPGDTGSDTPASEWSGKYAVVVPS